MADLTPATRPLRQRPVLALVSAEGHLVARLADDVPRAAVVRAPDDGLAHEDGVVLAAELAPIAVLGIPPVR